MKILTWRSCEILEICAVLASHNAEIATVTGIPKGVLYPKGSSMLRAIFYCFVMYNKFKHNLIFSLNRLHVPTVYGLHQADHKIENMYAAAFRNGVFITYLVASLSMTIYGLNRQLI